MSNESTEENKFITLHNRLKVRNDIHPKCSSCKLELKFPYETEDVNKYMTYPDVVKANRVFPLNDGAKPWVDNELLFFCDPCYHKIIMTIRMACLAKQESDSVEEQQEKDKQKMSKLLNKRCDEIEAIANGEPESTPEDEMPDIEIEKKYV